MGIIRDSIFEVDYLPSLDKTRYNLYGNNLRIRIEDLTFHLYTSFVGSKQARMNKIGVWCSIQPRGMRSPGI